MTERRSRTTTRRPLRTEVKHPRRPRESAQHARGERILRDGTLVKTRSAPVRAPQRRRTGFGDLRMPLASPPQRLHVIFVAMAIALSLCAGRLVQLQGFDSSSYSSDSLTRTLPLLPARGQLTDRNGLVLAATEPAVAVTADPTLIGFDAKGRPDPVKLDTAIAVMAGYLDLTDAQLRPILTKPNTRFVYVKKKVPALTYTALAKELANRGIYGVFRDADPVRAYPNGSVGAAVIGYVGGDGRGQTGLELSYNKELSGVEGKETFESAPNGSKIPLGQSSVSPAQNGINIQTSIDSELQWAADRALAAAVKDTRSDSGVALVMDAKTGQLLAVSNAPTFDSADPASAKKGAQGNRAVTDQYEPGSVEKVLTSAALIDSGTTKPTSRVLVPNRLPSGGGTLIKDFREHETMRYNMRGVIANSSNIGTALMTRQMSKPTLQGYLKSFGLGSPTGVELPGEATGILPGPDMADATRDRVAFGQSISVTAVQEIAAIAGIVNGGIYHPPTVVKSATDAAGNPVVLDDREPRRIISAKSSAQVRDLMQAVVDSPNGVHNLALPNYQTGGKTGTAQRVETKGGRSRYQGYVTSYVNFAPLNDPKLVTYVVLNNPRRGDTGTSTAAPVVKEIMNMALPRYSVAPDAKQHVALPTTW
jgi:cell division protein FtsI (penicillin-binding protein 3)